MLRRHGPLYYKHLLMSDSETESDSLSDYYNAQTQMRNKKKHIERKSHKSRRFQKEKFVDEEISNRDAKALKEDPETMVEQAKKYQERMKQIPIPETRGPDILFVTWNGLANSMKQLYGQPLHYLTHGLVKQWDESRIGTEGEEKAMESIINPRKAEATIWDVEEIHRRCTSHVHLAKLWLRDPGYLAFVHEVISSSSS